MKRWLDMEKTAMQLGGNLEKISNGINPQRLPAQFRNLQANSETLHAYAIPKMTGTSGRQRVPSEFCSPFWLVVPPPEVVHGFDELTVSQMANIKTDPNEPRTLANLRDTLLPTLFSGKLTVDQTAS